MFVRNFGNMSDHPGARLISASLPIYMSLVALLAMAKAAVNYRTYGPPPHEDVRWHVFMLMMFLQLPIILYFIIRCRRELRRALPVLLGQVSLLNISLGAGYCLPGLY
jgi:hypothetical protein